MSNQGTQILRSGLMDYAVQAEIHRIITETLAELGIPNARFSIADTTILVQDGSYIGRSLVCGHVRVVMLAGGERIEFHDQCGGILRSICVTQARALRGEAA